MYLLIRGLVGFLTSTILKIAYGKELEIFTLSDKMRGLVMPRTSWHGCTKVMFHRPKLIFNNNSKTKKWRNLSKSIVKRTFLLSFKFIACLEPKYQEHYHFDWKVWFVNSRYPLKLFTCSERKLFGQSGFKMCVIS